MVRSPLGDLRRDNRLSSLARHDPQPVPPSDPRLGSHSGCHSVRESPAKVCPLRYRTGPVAATTDDNHVHQGLNMPSVSFRFIPLLIAGPRIVLSVDTTRR